MATSRRRAQPYGMVISRGVPVLRRVRRQQDRQHRSRDVAITSIAAQRGTRPRRVAITSDDVLWYADYSRGYLGRLDPKTGKATEWPSPGGAESQPYGITALHDVIWYSESRSGRTRSSASIRNGKVSDLDHPLGGGVVRNMMPTRDGDLAIAESGVNGLALVSIHSGARSARGTLKTWGLLDEA